MSVRLATVAATGILLVAVPAAEAGTITFSNVVATWSDANPAAVAGFVNNGTGSPSANWGGGALPSGYDFVSATPPNIDVSVPPSPSNDFVIGTFTHRNQPIPAGTSITGIKLSVTMDVAIDTVAQGTSTFVFDFVHNETPNGDIVCADGGANTVGVNSNGCADSVTVFYNLLSQSFDIDGDEYTVVLRGFQLGGNPVSTFWTKEVADNTANLVAFVTLRADAEQFAAVPEPASMVLLGTGLLALGVRRWRRR